jgi:hypothetical protein
MRYLFYFSNKEVFINVGGQTGKGVNLVLFGGANKACVAGRQTG